jgi:hypothetical protein
MSLVTTAVMRVEEVVRMSLQVKDGRANDLTDVVFVPESPTQGQEQSGLSRPDRTRMDDIPVC